MFIRALTFLLLLVLPSVFCRAQNCVMFTRDDGLSSTLVRFLFEDSGGMMWVATENGLNRYDGSRFTQYYHDPADPNSLAGNFVNSIYEDSRGRLFVCTHSGVQLYDPFTDSFSPAALLDGQPSGQVSAVTERSGGELWAVGNTLSAIHVDGDGLSLSRLPLDAQLGYAELLPRALGRGDGRVLAVGAAEGAAGEEYGPAAPLARYAGLLAEVRRGPRRVGEGAHAAVSAPAELAVHAAVPRAVMARAHSPISSFVCP